MKQAWITIAALLAVSCDRAPQPAAAGNTTDTRLMSGCADADRLIRQMSAAESSFRVDDQGNARISKSLWEATPDEMKEGLVKAIAYQAICAAGEPGEQRVTIRASEGSQVLKEETVTDFDQ